jgi:hypothetical protein
MGRRRQGKPSADPMDRSWYQNGSIAHALKPKAEFQPDASTDAVENNSLTDSRERTMIVNTPRIVPKGIKMHSMQATTNANQ